MTYQLICHGSCNVILAYVDRLIAHAPRVGGLPALTSYQIDAQRTLVHTPHVMVTDDTAKCLTCGRSRRYGGQAIGYTDYYNDQIAKLVAVQR